MTFDIWAFLENFEKIRVTLKSDKNKGYFGWRSTHSFDHISFSS